jgi:putative ABC transport system permease protein
MLKNYFLIAYRNLRRNKEYSFINIAGPAISIASCLVLYYMVRYELSFDTFHANRERIYRITNEASYPEGMDYGQGVPAPLPVVIGCRHGYGEFSIDQSCAG